MTVTVTTRPLLPLVGDVSVAFTATEGGFVRVFVEAAPDGSQLAKDILAAGGTVQVHSSDADRPWKFKADAPGIYVLRIDEIDRDPTVYAGGWRGVPNTGKNETVVSTQSAEVVVGAPLVQPIGWGSVSGQLVLHIFDGTVQTLTTQINGQASPRLQNASSILATAQVEAAVAAMGGIDEDDLIRYASGYVGTIAGQIWTHMTNASGSYHSTADTYNAPDQSLLTPTSVQGMADTIALMQDALKRHIKNYGAGGAGTGDYHDVTTSDGIPQAPAPAGAKGLFVALGDLIAAIQIHVANEAAHEAIGPTITSPEVATLLDVHYKAAQAIRQVSATPNITEHSGLPDLIATGGFSRL